MANNWLIKHQLGESNIAINFTPPVGKKDHHLAIVFGIVIRINVIQAANRVAAQIERGNYDTTISI